MELKCNVPALESDVLSAERERGRGGGGREIEGDRVL